MKTLFSKKRSVIFTWLVSYSLILVIPIFISGVIYLQTFSMFESEINNSNKLLLKKMQQKMDSLLTDAQRLSEEISLNSRVNALLINDKDLDDLSSYDLFQTLNSLGTYKIPGSSVDDFFIYFKHMDLVLSSYSNKNSRFHYDTYLNRSGVTFEAWYGMISQSYKGSFITSMNFSTLEKGKKSIVMVRTVPLLSRSGRYANIVISLDESKFMGDAADIEALNQGLVAIIDDKNKIITSSSGDFDLTGLRYDDLEGADGFTHTKIDGRKAVISYTNSQVTDWKYVAVVPNEVFWKKAQYIKRLTLVGIVLCLCIGGVLVCVSLRKNYNPVSELVKLLEKSQGMNFSKKDNEYMFIHQMVHQIQSDKNKVDAILKQQNKEIKSELLTRLIKGKTGGNLPVQDALALSDIHFTTEDFAVMIFYIEDYAEVFSGELPIREDASSLEKFKMVQFIMTNVIEEMIGQKNNLGFMTDIDDILVCLVNFGPGGAEHAKEELSRVGNESQEFMGKHFRIQFKVAISSAHKTLMGIPEAYSEALQVLEYKKVLGIEDFNHYQDIIEMPKGDYYYPLEVEQQLINYIKVGDLEHSQIILNDIFKKNFESSILSVKVARCLMFDLVSTMIKTMNEASYAGYNDLMESLNPIETLIGCENINDMRREMIYILDGFCKHIQAKEKSRNKGTDLQLVNNVMEYVQNGYSDPNLSVTTIAEHFRVHVVHLSRAFKEHFGESLSDHINSVRIHKAKELLNKLDNLEDVSKAAGYSNIRTFMRVFKKLEGITPGKYKRIE